MVSPDIVFLVQILLISFMLFSHVVLYLNYKNAEAMRISTYMRYISDSKSNAFNDNSSYGAQFWSGRQSRGSNPLSFSDNKLGIIKLVALIRLDDEDELEGLQNALKILNLRYD